MHAPPTSQRSLAPYAAFAGSSLIWGSTFLVISIGNDQLPPMWAAALRLLVAALLLTLILRVLRVPFPRGAALAAAAQFGFVNFGLSFCLLYWAETRVPSGLTAVIYATIPLSTSLLARAFGLEQLSVFKVAGALVALGGVVFIFSGRLSLGVEPLHLVAVLLAATCASLSGVLLKRGPRQHPLGANAAGAWVGLAVCLAGSFLAGESHVWPRTSAAIVPVLYLATFGSIAAFGLYAWLVNHWPVSKISFIAVVVPVVAVALGTLLRHERLNAAEATGSLLVLGGLALAIASDRLRRAR